MALGDRGSDVKDVQRQLNEYGAGLAVDGIWGPLTQAAYEKYSTEMEAETNPVSEPAGTAGTPGQDYTAENTQGRFNVIGGFPNVWLNTDTGKYLIVYDVPNTDPPIPVYWEVPDEKTLQSYFGEGNTPTPDRSVTNDQLVSYGALGQGYSTEMPATDQDPLLGWAEIYERQSTVRPYLKNPEVMGLIMGAALEGRSVSQAELETTIWWQTQSEAQREWAIKSEADPVSAQQTYDANRIRVQKDLNDSGVANAPNQLIDFLTTKFTHGQWNENVLLSQISAISDPSSIYSMKPETQALLDGLGMTVDQTRGQEDTVKSMLNEWLGPQYGAWSQQDIAAKAGEIRNDPDAEIRFKEMLQQQRLALFPQYEDENMTYQAIAGPWRNFAYSTWGQQIDELDPLFGQMLLQNDSVENGKLLTREGLKRGIGKVTTDLQTQILNATGGSVVRAS